MLGGFLARKGDGEPGVKTIWIGLQRIMDFAAGVRFADDRITQMPPQTHQHFETGQNSARSHRRPQPIGLLDPKGHGGASTRPRSKTKKAYMWAYARGAFEAERGEIGRASCRERVLASV